MKKFFTVAASLILSAAMLTACGSSAAPAATTGAPETTAAAVTQAPETTEETKSFHIAIVQQLDHASLDEIRLAVEDELTKAAADKGFQVSYKEFNGQNDNTVLNQIGAQVVSDKYDAIIPIASLAAQCMVTAADGTNTPIIYAAVSDPATAGLTDIANVTGTEHRLHPGHDARRPAGCEDRGSAVFQQRSQLPDPHCPGQGIPGAEGHCLH